MSQVFIELSQNFYYVGDTVTGHIFLNLQDNYDEGKIKLKIKGWESAQWIDKIHHLDDPSYHGTSPKPHEIMNESDCEISQSSTDSSDAKQKTKKGFIRDRNGQQQVILEYNTHIYYIYNEKLFLTRLFRIINHAGGRKFLKLEIPLEGFGKGQIRAGQYSIPFSFMLNPEFPGTFSLKTDQHKGRVKYEMRVKCEFDDGKEREFKHKVELIVREKSVVMTNLDDSITTNVMCCCCIPKGETKFKVKFEKSVYQMGEPAKMICEVDNSKCSSNVDCIEAALMHDTRLIDKNGEQFSYTRRLITKEFGGVAAGEKAIGKESRHEQLKIENKIISKKMVINPSIDGKFVKSEYFLRVQCIMDATCNGCCNDIPLVCVPIQIYPEFFPKNKFHTPNNWNPQVFQVYNIPIGQNNNIYQNPMHQPQTMLPNQPNYNIQPPLNPMNNNQYDQQYDNMVRYDDIHIQNAN